jgi:O-antigen ligase
MTVTMTSMSRRSSEPAAAKAVARVPRLAEIADGLAAAAAVSLPWSTSATAVLIVLWLIALVPTLDVAAVRREVMSAAGGLPVLLWALGAVGMLWADVGWSERIAGLSGYHKLLVIPLLLAQFRRPSARPEWVILGFLASALVLLVLSWALVLTPGLSWRGRNEIGVPVKNYILQSAIFAICAFGLIGLAAELWRMRVRLALAALFAAAALIANIAYVSTARTTLVVMAVMLLLLGFRQSRWKGALGAALIGGTLTAAVWTSSPYLRERVSPAITQVQTHGESDVNTPVGLRLEYWKKSLALIAEAPVIGHGTGTIPQLFRRDATAETIESLITTNPHNQVLAVALELGFVGAVSLIAMWLAHLALFRDGVPLRAGIVLRDSTSGRFPAKAGPGLDPGRTSGPPNKTRQHNDLIAWFGLVVVIYNVVSSAFNSHLFDFGQGWLYVIGLGVTGGMVLRGAPRDSTTDAERAANAGDKS